MLKNSIFLFTILNTFISFLMASSIPNKLFEIERSFRIGNVSHITDAELKINGPILTHALASFIEHDKNPLNDIFAESLVEKKFFNISDRERFCFAFSSRIIKRVEHNGFMNPDLIKKFKLTKEKIDMEIKKIKAEMITGFQPVRVYNRRGDDLGSQ